MSRFSLLCFQNAKTRKEDKVIFSSLPVLAFSHFQGNNKTRKICRLYAFNLSYVRFFALLHFEFFALFSDWWTLTFCIVVLSLSRIDVFVHFCIFALWPVATMLHLWLTYGGWFTRCRIFASKSENTERRQSLTLSSLHVFGFSTATTRHTTTRRFSCFASDRTTVRQCAVWRVSLLTKRKGEDDIGCGVAIDNATRKVYQISNHRNTTDGMAIYDIFYVSYFLPFSVLFSLSCLVNPKKRKQEESKKVQLCRPFVFSDFRILLKKMIKLISCNENCSFD
jgi:hypothetical protein